MPQKDNKNNTGRRTFLKGMSTLAAGVYALPFAVSGKPFTENAPAHRGIPENKELNRQWINSLSERGTPTVYLKSKNELRNIGMPVGGIFTGTLYLGGDGKLWLWDIFNLNQTGIDPKEITWAPMDRKVRSQDGSAYLEPPASFSKQGIEQGFAVKVECNGKEYIRQLREADWEEIKFKGQYPVATIEYTDAHLPFSVEMECFSPFIPLNADDSGLPATIFSITVHNHSSENMNVSLAGWLQNACLLNSGNTISFERSNRAIKENDLVAVLCQSNGTEDADKKDISHLPDFGTLCMALLDNNGEAYTDFNTGNLKDFDFKNDQLFGQSYAYQVGLGRILDKDKVLTALHSLWKYNFMPDVGPYIAHHKGGRPYALSGEGGMLMDTNPHNDADPYGTDVAWQVGYFNECMSGFEHQVASHLMVEGMVGESLTLTKNIHDRYHAAKRNPYNEIECSDHYARAMASFGTFISACGFEYHGPKGYLAFAPKINPENFKAPFTTAEGWGTYSQQKNENAFSAQLTIRHGKLNLKRIKVTLDKSHHARSVKVVLNGKNIPCSFEQADNSCTVQLKDKLLITESQTLSLFL